MVTCLIDNSEWSTLDEMHAHLKTHMKRSMYYEKYFPRVCKHTGQKIVFKDYKQYFAQDFIDGDVMQAWFEANPQEGLIWVTEWLKRRKEEKGLIYAPSYVELRSLQRPGHRDGYYNLTASLGFRDRYTKQSPVFATLPSDVCIVCDTREQLPLKLSVPVLRKKVEEGDYALAAPNDRGIYIERKGLGDFVGTLNSRKVEKKKGEDSAAERFDRELARAETKGHYIVMLVECGLEEALHYDRLKEMRHTKVGPSHTFKNLRDLLVKYPLTFQVVFARDRRDAAAKVIRLFQMGQQVRQIDLEYANQKGLL